MSEETIFQTEIRAALKHDAVPPVDLSSIYGRAPQAQRPVVPTMRIAAATAAAFACALLLMPQAQAVVQSMESRVEAAMRAMGIAPGPPISKSVVTMLESRTHRADFAQAAKQVPFTLVEPRGIPADARLAKIYIAPTAQWTGHGAQWHVSGKIVLFQYTRANGNGFTLQATQYDPSQTLSAYMWQTVEKPNGDPVFVGNKLKLIRHDALHWRNGDQLMNAVTGEGLTMEDARTIERAMNGRNIAGIKTSRPHASGKMMILKP